MTLHLMEDHMKYRRSKHIHLPIRLQRSSHRPASTNARRVVIFDFHLYKLTFIHGRNAPCALYVYKLLEAIFYEILVTLANTLHLV